MRRILFLVIMLMGMFFKCDAQITFQQTFGGSSNAVGFSSCPTSDGGCIVVGGSSAFGNGGQVYAVRLDSSGAIIWTRNYGSALSDQIKTIFNPGDDGFIGCGTAMGNGSIDIFLLRANSYGDTIWTRTIDGFGFESVIDFRKCPDSTYLIFGKGDFFDDFNILRVDDSGNILWSKILHITDSYSGHVITVNEDGSFYVSVSVSSNSYFTTSINKFSEDGVLLWSKKYGVPNEILDLFAMTVTSDGGCILVGEYGYSIALVRLDQNGNIVWSKEYNGIDSDVLYSIIPTSDGKFICAGYHYNVTGRDLLIFRFDQNGNMVSQNIFGRFDYNETGRSIVESKDGGFYVTGNEDDSTNTHVQIYLAKINQAGSSGCQDRPVMLANMGSITIQVDPFQPSISNTTMTLSEIPIFVGTGGTANSICNTIGIEDISSNPHFNIYPNPFTGNFHIFFSEKNPYEKLVICNALGEIILQKVMSGEQSLNINLENQPAGIYVLRFESGSQFQATRICLTN